jgi:methylenetetrahydrofolate reductase (NADPH)
MSIEKSNLQKRIDSGKSLILAEIAPPASSDAQQLKALVKRFAGKVHGLGISDNREGVTMSALAAASMVLAEGVEPILHMTTRDRNRAALVSDFLGAKAFGIQNVLCTSGSHQTLGQFRSSKNVYDIDATILLQTFKNLGTDASIVGSEKLDGSAPMCLGAVASPYADPIELQLPRLAQKIFVGAQFVITHPVFDMDRFGMWWNEVKNRGLYRKAAFIAGIRVLTDEKRARTFSEHRPVPLVTDAILKRLAAASGAEKCRKEGIAIAVETINKLSMFDGIRGFQVVCDEDPQAAVEVLQSLERKADFTAD